MSKINIIDYCVDCSHYRAHWICGHPDTHNRDLADPNKTIQEWCPLEDAKEPGQTDASLRCLRCGKIEPIWLHEDCGYRWGRTT